VLKAEGGDAAGSLGEQVSRATAILFVLLILLALGWLFGVVHNWGEIASRPVRLAYLICDFTIVIPSGLVSIWGLRNGRRWASLPFVFALGALLFDTAHGVFYLLWDNYFGVPWIVAFVVLIALGIYVVYAIRVVQANLGL